MDRMSIKDLIIADEYLYIFDEESKIKICKITIRHIIKINIISK